jgi:single-strand DNA-binding protein
MLNKVQLIGNLGKDPELKETQKGGSICTFSIATTKRWKKDGEKQEKTEWHRIVSFAKKLNENVIKPYVKKGNKVYIEGELQTRSWEDDAGATRFMTEVVLNEFSGTLTMLGDRNAQNERQDDPTPAKAPTDAPDDEIPF